MRPFTFFTLIALATLTQATLPLAAQQPQPKQFKPGFNLFSAQQDVPVKLIVTSSLFRVNDGSGRSVPQKVPTEIPFSIALGATPVTIHLFVVGVGP